MGVLPTYMSVYHVLAWCPQKPGESIGALGLELQIVVINPMGAEKETPVLWKSSLCS